MKKHVIKGTLFAAFILLFTALLIVSTGCTKCDDKGVKEPVVSEQIKEKKSDKKTGYRTMEVTVTAYCPCTICNTKKWAGMVSTGRKIKDILAEGYNICAADPAVIPLRTKIAYDGLEYLVADTSSAIKGKRINILKKTHSKTTDFGVKRNQTIKIYDK